MDGALRPARLGLLAAGAAVCGAALAGQLAGAGSNAVDTAALAAPLAVGYAAMGALVLAGRPGHPVGRLMFAAGATAGLATVAASWLTVAPLAWLAQWTWWPPLGLAFLALLVFPDGRLPTPRWRPVAVTVAAATALAAVALAVAALDHPRDLLTDVVDLTPRARLLIRLAAVAGLAAALGWVATVFSLWRRWRQANGDVRRQLACLVPAGLLILLGLGIDIAGLPGGWPLIGGSVPAAMAVAVLRHRLYGVDQAVGRATVWLVMTVLVVSGYTLLVLALDTAMRPGADMAVPVAAALAVALGFEPLRRAVQHGVNRLLYGDRDDPYEVLSRLGGAFAQVVAPDALLPQLAGVIAQSLRVPYVAVDLPDAAAGRPRRVAEHGTPADAETFPMPLRGDTVGWLVVAVRGPDDRFTGRERRLLADLACQAAVAVEATRLVRDLQQSRERLVMAREEERRRLRRDLHDGLGPALTGMAIQLRAARKRLTGAPTAAATLDTLGVDLRDCTIQMRQLVDELRPPVLDQGLAGALRTVCDRFDGSPMRVEFDIDNNLDDLPAAVEVAMFRIVSEALANAARHARARTCRVTIRRDRALTADIADDGIGMTGGVSGVGLDSMRERAAELGGECRIGDAAPGVVVHVTLPVPLAAVHR